MCRWGDGGGEACFGVADFIKLILSIRESERQKASSPKRGKFKSKKRMLIPDCREPAREIPPMTRSCEGDLTSKASGLEGLPGPIPHMTRSCRRDLTSKADQDSRDPLYLLEHLPQTQNLSYYFMPFTNSSDVNRGLSPKTFLWKKST